MFALRVVLVLSLVEAVVLGNVGGGAGQVSQQELDQKGGRLWCAGRLGHAHVEVWRPGC